MLLALTLAACASGNSCADYIVALETCTEESGASGSYDADAICGDWTAELEDRYGDWYQCQQSAYTTVECKSAADLNDAGNAAATCRRPEEG